MISTELCWPQVSDCPQRSLTSQFFSCWISRCLKQVPFLKQSMMVNIRVQVSFRVWRVRTAEGQRGGSHGGVLCPG